MDSFLNEEHDILDAAAPMEFRGYNINDLMVGAVMAMLLNLLVLKPSGLPDWLTGIIMVAIGFSFVKIATWYRDNYPPYLVFHYFAWLRSGKYQVPTSDETNLPLTISREYMEQIERESGQKGRRISKKNPAKKDK